VSQRGGPPGPSSSRWSTLRGAYCAAPVRILLLTLRVSHLLIFQTASTGPGSGKSRCSPGADPNGSVMASTAGRRSELGWEMTESWPLFRGQVQVSRNRKLTAPAGSDVMPV